MRVIGYARVSTDDQADRGISLEDQRARISAYVEAHGLELLGVETENASAKSLARPVLTRCLQRLSDGRVDGVVFVKLDRLSRATRDVLHLADRAAREGWALHSIEEKLDTSTPQGRFVLTILGALAEMERAQTAARTRSALEHLRANGKRTSGRPPYGFRFVDGSVKEVPEEQSVLKTIRELASRGWGAYRIATELTRRGIEPRKGGAWTASSIRSISATDQRRRAEAQ